MSNARENVNLLASADFDIAALRLANWGAGAVPPQVMLKQNWVAGDGGGLFRYDASDTTTSDNGGTVIVDAAGNRWKRQWSGEVHSRWFARGDGTTNDTAALNAWLALTSSYPLILNAAPGGKYNITAALTPVLGNDIFIAGEGEKSRIDYVGASTTPGDLLVFGDAVTDYDVLTLRDFEIGSSTTLTDGYALRIKDYTNVRLDLAINGGGKCYKGLRLEGCAYVWLNSTQIYSLDNRCEMNDCIEVNLGFAEFLPANVTTGIHVLIGGGCGGVYGQDSASLFGSIGVQIDTSLWRGISFSGTTTSGSATVTGIASTASLVAGMNVFGTGMPAGAYIVSKTSNSITLNANATASGTGVSLTAHNGNTQIMLGNSVWDGAVNAACLVNDSSNRPSGKILCLDSAWLASSNPGSGLSVVNWTGGCVTGAGPVIRSNAGFGINIDDPTVRVQLSAAASIAWNVLGGVNAASAMTIWTDAEPFSNGGAAYSANIERARLGGRRITVTIANGGNAALPVGSGVWQVANETNGDVAAYAVGGGGVVRLAAGTAGTWETPTTTPGAGNCSVAFDGSAAYRIYNNAGGSRTFVADLTQLRPGI